MGWTYNRAYKALAVGDRVVVANAERKLRDMATVTGKRDWPLQEMTLRFDGGASKTLNNTFRSWRLYPVSSITGETIVRNTLD